MVHTITYSEELDQQCFKSPLPSLSKYVFSLQ